jgi:endonuclease G
MAPAANFVYDAKVMSESFFLSNMMPQAPGNNRGIWKYLEEYTRSWATKYGQVYVITGAIFDKDSRVMGANKVKVPSFVYKIVIEPKSGKTIAFMFPNEKLDPKTINDYTLPVAELEQYTRINFSPALPAQLKNSELTKGSMKDW